MRSCWSTAARATLNVSRALNPKCEHVEADPRRVRLGRHLDCVFIQDASGYMTREHDLRKTIQTAFVKTQGDLGKVRLNEEDFHRVIFEMEGGLMAALLK